MYSRDYGNGTGEDIRRRIEEIGRDDRFEQHRQNMLDFSDATEVVTRENVRAALERFRALGVSTDEARMFSTIAD